MIQKKEYLYKNVAERIEKSITSGVFQIGDKLPSIRELSKSEGVSMSTASQTYFHLEAKGFVQARHKSGFYVSKIREAKIVAPTMCKSILECTPVKFDDYIQRIYMAMTDPNMLPFGTAITSTDLFPSNTIKRITNELMRKKLPEILNYAVAPGLFQLRKEISKRYLSFGINVNPDEIIVTNGCTEALSVALKALTKPGDVIAVESPFYFGVLQTIENAGLRAIEISSDSTNGLNLEDLKHAINTLNIKACLLMTNYNNPTGGILTDEKKKELVDFLDEHDVPIIEDDVYGDLGYGNYRPSILKKYDKNGIVLTCTSFSKSIAPGLRIGYIIPGKHYKEVLKIQRMGSLAVSSLPQLVVASFLESGGYERHLRKLRTACETQTLKYREFICNAMECKIKISKPMGGHLLWLELPEHVDCLKIHQKALENNISITPGILFSPNLNYKNYVRINCGTPWSPLIENGLIALCKLMKEEF